MLKPENQLILSRLEGFAKLKVGDKWGWQKRFAELIGLSPSNVNSLLKGRQAIGPGIRERLAAAGCDLIWLKTGKKAPIIDASYLPAIMDPNKIREMIDMLGQFGIKNADELKEKLEENARLRHALGAETYATVLEVAAVRERRARYKPKRKEK